MGYTYPPTNNREGKICREGGKRKASERESRCFWLTPPPGYRPHFFLSDMCRRRKFTRLDSTLGSILLGKRSFDIHASWGGNLSRMTVVTVLNFAQYKRGAKIHSLDCCSGSPDSRSVWRSRVLFARAPEGANDSTCFFPTEERGREEDGINNGGSDEERGRKR